MREHGDGGLRYRITEMEPKLKQFFQQVDVLLFDRASWCGMLEHWCQTEHALKAYRMIERGAGHVPALIEDVIFDYPNIALFVLLDDSVAEIVMDDGRARKTISSQLHRGV